MRHALLFLAVVSAAGCSGRDANEKPDRDAKEKPLPHLADREKIARQLPSDLRLHDRIPREVGNAAKGGPIPDSAKTVEQTLLDVGGHLDKAGKLVDGEGRPIVFMKQHIPGTPPPPRTYTDKPVKDGRSPEEKERDEIREEIRAIDKGPDPGHILPLKTRRIIYYEFRIDK